MDKQEIKTIEPFLKLVRKKYAPEQILLFGSRARGDAWKRSDYDFIIVSSKFKGVHWLERISRLVHLWEETTDIDILPYTPEEFEEKKKNSSTVRSAVKEGQVL
ncbi:nucleotidyltransferase domain-containing protein [Candidatus Woesearchaeota archaeon]|nr:nucleotidyltransferase domain-containing protein [Candidatus Woesearchaeota archaeon]